MRLFEAWRRALRSERVSNTDDARWAFQAGARYALNQLIDHLDESDEATKRALRLNDEIRDFAKVSLLQS